MYIGHLYYEGVPQSLTKWDDPPSTARGVPWPSPQDLSGTLKLIQNQRVGGTQFETWGMRTL